MSLEDYIQEAESQLQDVNFYKEIKEDLTSKHSAEILQLLSSLSLKKEITEKTIPIP